MFFYISVFARTHTHTDNSISMYFAEAFFVVYLIRTIRRVKELPFTVKTPMVVSSLQLTETTYRTLALSYGKRHRTLYIIAALLCAMLRLEVVARNVLKV